jgi:hypothetical protein
MWKETCLIFLNAIPKFDQMAKTMKASCLGMHRPCDGPASPLSKVFSQISKNFK